VCICVCVTHGGVMKVRTNMEHDKQDLLLLRNLRTATLNTTFPHCKPMLVLTDTSD
jgi:hypothetical protein